MNHVVERINVRYRRTLLLFSVLFIVALLPAPGWARAGHITVEHRLQADDLTVLAQRPLAALTSDPTGTDGEALALYWAQDASGWFPVWQLQLWGEPSLLPSSAVTGSDGLATVTLANVNPAAGHTYVTTLSYAGDAGALAVKVTDETDGRHVYATGVVLPVADTQLYAAAGMSKPYYIPAGTMWAVGSGGDQLPFVVSSQFTKRDDKARIRLTSPEPLPPGHYDIAVQHGDETKLLATVQPQTRETFVPLPLDTLPWGTSTLQLEYVHDGTVLLSDHMTVTLGQVDFRMQPVVANRDAGYLETSFTVQPAAALDEPLAVNVRATISELKWNDETRQFDLMPYAVDVPIGSAVLDLDDGSSTMTVQVPLPDRQGNWQVRVTPELPARLATRVHGDIRWFSTYEPATVQPGEAYRIVVLPDTQYFAARHPETFLRMTDWIAANAERMGIAAVLHVGDITDDNSPRQWENAHAGMSLLHDVVPYVFAMGNHDMVAPDGSAMRGHTRINTYFPADMAKRYSNLAGTMKPDQMQNHYSLLSIAGDDYLVISLEFWPPDEAVAWARDVAGQYPDHRLVLLTHSYLSSAGNLALVNNNYPITKDPNTTVNHGVAMWELLMRLQENSFMTISGHVTPATPVVPYRVARNIAGKPVFQLLFDWQNQPLGGNGWLGIMTFNPDDTVDVTVYSPFLGEYADTTDNNGFTSNVRLDLAAGTSQRLPYVDRPRNDDN